jgi:hypothetical protein
MHWKPIGLRTICREAEVDLMAVRITGPGLHFAAKQRARHFSRDM